MSPLPDKSRPLHPDRPPFGSALRNGNNCIPWWRYLTVTPASTGKEAETNG